MRTFLPLLVAATACTTPCSKTDELDKRIDALEKKVTEIKAGVTDEAGGGKPPLDELCQRLCGLLLNAMYPDMGAWSLRSSQYNHCERNCMVEGKRESLRLAKYVIMAEECPSEVRYPNNWGEHIQGIIQEELGLNEDVGPEQMSATNLNKAKRIEEREYRKFKSWLRCLNIPADYKKWNSPVWGAGAD